MSVLHLERLGSMPGADEALKANTSAAVDAMRSAGGALWAEVTEVEDGLLVLSEWRTVSDLDAWERSERCVGLLRDRDVLLSGPPTTRRFAAEF